jgi:hypothetical protein
MLKETNHKSGTQQALGPVAQAVGAGKRPDDAQKFMTPLIARFSTPGLDRVEAMAAGRFLAD